MVLHELMEDCLLMSCLLNDARGMLDGAVVVVVVYCPSAYSRIGWIILRLYVYVNNFKTNSTTMPVDPIDRCCCCFLNAAQKNSLLCGGKARQACKVQAVLAE